VAISPTGLPQDANEPGASGAPPQAGRPDDVELAEKMKAGNEQAFATFYDRFAPGVFSMIYAILRDQKESEDVLQEAFLQMWKRTSTYDPGRSSLFTWAMMISRHKAIDRLRARQRQSRVIDSAVSEVNEGLTIPEREADDPFARQDERERVRAALAQLGDAQREAINLAFFAGLTQTEISEKLGAPLGTVKARIRRGLLALRELLGEKSS
jgi:RNA polymerase sigma-70 factor (ECF subfamily)